MKGEREGASQSSRGYVCLLRSAKCYWFSALLYVLIGFSFMATVKRLCDYKEENFRLMQQLAVEKQKECVLLC